MWVAPDHGTYLYEITVPDQDQILKNEYDVTFPDLLCGWGRGKNDNTSFYIMYIVDYPSDSSSVRLFLFWMILDPPTTTDRNSSSPLVRSHLHCSQRKSSKHTNYYRPAVTTSCSQNYHSCCWRSFRRSIPFWHLEPSSNGTLC